MTSYAVVTTCNAEGWRRYGRRMAETFNQFWPVRVGLYVYAEGFDPGGDNGETVRRLPPWHAAWKERHAGNADAHGQAGHGYNFKRDAVKFSHKAAAIYDAAFSTRTDVLIWADADIITHGAVTTEWLDGLFPRGPYIAWLDRDGIYPECGFYMIDTGHPRHDAVTREFRLVYETDAVFQLPETHDSYVLQKIIDDFESRGDITVHSLSGTARRTSHPLVNGPLGACLDHLKGGRKDEGRSRRSDLRIARTEEYWR